MQEGAFPDKRWFVKLGRDSKKSLAVGASKYWARNFETPGLLGDACRHAKTTVKEFCLGECVW